MRDPWTVLGTIDAIAPKYRGSERRDDGTTRLAREVSIVIEKDPMYGPRHDAERHRVGVEYETILEEVLQSLDIPFESENDLRQRGTSRTPDILLSCPFAINVGTETDERWKPVCWIDSKALFGDVKTHKESVIPQAESYVHRFGPGLLLYWFGHAPLQLLDDAQGDIAICGWDLPDQILLPTGDFVNTSSS
mmetsp:Transcript_32176/g.45751  ORF Transcript_32176/g.45751 Transcript_32176/m.45751 type:complete len:192 (+) Transcript_32176:504-1079(+)